MAVTSQKDSESVQWVELRGFTSDESGFEYPKYEMKVLSDVEREHVEDDITMIKETDPRSGHEKMYQLPTDVVEAMTKQVQTQQ